MSKYFKHFKVIFEHKMVVMYYCFKCGLYWQGLTHDNSKFGIAEFFTSARYFQGTGSPIDKEKSEKGYSFAWQHHKGRNPHHWEYWIDNIGDNAKNGNPPDALKIPEKYLYELVCDWIGAGKIYEKEKWNKNAPQKYYEKKKDTIHMNAETKALLEEILTIISEISVQIACKGMKYKAMKYEEPDNA